MGGLFFCLEKLHMGPMEYGTAARPEGQGSGWGNRALTLRSTHLRIGTPQSGLLYKKLSPALCDIPHPLPVWPIASTSQFVARFIVTVNLEKSAQHAFQAAESMEGEPEGHPQRVLELAPLVWRVR
jgi:hypothetical protein